MSDAARAKADEVWADEGGRALRVVEIDAGHVRIEITEGINGHVREGVTLGRWRWDRLVVPYAAEQTARAERAEAERDLLRVTCDAHIAVIEENNAEIAELKAQVERLREFLNFKVRAWLSDDQRTNCDPHRCWHAQTQAEWYEQLDALLAEYAVQP